LKTEQKASNEVLCLDVDEHKEDAYRKGKTRIFSEIDDGSD